MWAKTTTFEDPEHPNKILMSLAMLRDKGDLCDVILCCEEQCFPCHRSVLASFSPYFEVNAHMYWFSVATGMAGLAFMWRGHHAISNQLLTQCAWGRPKPCNHPTFHPSNLHRGCLHLAWWRPHRKRSPSRELNPSYWAGLLTMLTKQVSPSPPKMFRYF